MIASKYEEIYAPEVGDMVYVTDKAFTKDQILKMENSILLALNFNINSPSSFRFLERMSKLSKADDLVFNHAWYMIELTLSDQMFYRFKPSLIAAASLYLTKKILKRKEPWNAFLEQQTGYKDKDLRLAAKDLASMLNDAHTQREVSSIFRKFSSSKHIEVAKVSADFWNN